jgi:hypothetical protein
MDPEAIIADLTRGRGLPKEALRAAESHRRLLVPRFIQIIEDHIALPPSERPEKTPLFFIFHLLGEWRQESAYRPLLRLLRLPEPEIGKILGDAITTTSNRVVASVFDGDPQPIFDAILDAHADEFVRSRMCEALSYLGLAGQIERRRSCNFLRDCFANLSPQGPCYVWVGWQIAIARLGLAELSSIVEMAFKRGYVDSWWTRFEHFQKELAQAGTDHGRARWLADNELTPFGDTLEELSHWAGFREKDQDKPRLDKVRQVRANPKSDQKSAPCHRAQFSKIGRNERCPCGSGKKYKRCCGTASLGFDSAN